MHQPAFTPFGPEIHDDGTAQGEPMLEGNRADLFEHRDDVLAALTEMFGNALNHINLDAALLQAPALSDELVACLGEQCRKGVRVQVIAQQPDMTGAVDALSRLCDAGVTLNEARPRKGARGWVERRLGTASHRQLAVVDGQVAWCGPGMQGAGPCAAGPHVCVSGPIVQRLQRLFLETWHASRPAVQLPQANYFPPMQSAGPLRMGVCQPADALEVATPGGALVEAVENARLSVFIGLASQPPSRQLRKAVAAAVARGVEVSVMVPEHATAHWNWRRHCAALVRSQARVYVTQGPCPFPAHGVVDGTWSHIALRHTAAWPGATPVTEELTVHGPAFAQALEAACRRGAGTRLAVEAGQVPARQWWRSGI